MLETYFGDPDGRHLARSGKDVNLQWPVAPYLLGTSWATRPTFQCSQNLG